MMIKCGDKFREGFKDKWNTGVYHIVNIFNDDGVELIVYKTWMSRKQYWRYFCQPTWVIKDKIRTYNGQANP